MTKRKKIRAIQGEFGVSTGGGGGSNVKLFNYV